MQNTSLFRPDVEGLRAVAVLAVVAFHYFGEALFPGGFVGVDIFFVISGYLITRNIANSAQRGTFSLKTFYVRRIRRLFPALLVTVMATLIVGTIVAPLHQIESISNSSIAAIFSVSNIYFWMQSGYFDSSALDKPLLHTWSLAVEEQFYMFWPLLTLWLIRHLNSVRGKITALALLSSVALLLTEYMMRHDAAGAFYLTPFRIAEFAIGAICVWIPSRVFISSRSRDLTALLGFGMILFSLLRYSEAIPFPGLTAMLPCFGTALVIAADGNGLVGRFLRSKPAVLIGSISYSLYLVHWPFWVYGRDWLAEWSVLSRGVLLFVASLLLAYAMFKFIEQPFRLGSRGKQEPLPTPVFARRFVGLTIATVAVALLLKSDLARNWRLQMGDRISAIVAQTDSEKGARYITYRERCLGSNEGLCEKAEAGKVNVVIIGDSHAPDALNALAFSYPQFHFIMRTTPACPPLTREDFKKLPVQHPHRDKCIARNEDFLYGDVMNGADLIVINSVFNWFTLEELQRSIAQIRKRSDAPLMVFGNYLFFDEELPNLVAQHRVTRLDDFYLKHLKPHSLKYDAELRDLASRLHFIYISKRDMLCRGPEVIDCPILFDGKLYSYDTHHFSVAGADALGKAVKNHYGDFFDRLQKSIDAKSASRRVPVATSDGLAHAN